MNPGQNWDGLRSRDGVIQGPMNRTLSHVVAGLTGVCFVLCGYSIVIGFHYPTDHVWDWVAAGSAIGLGAGAFTLYHHG